MFERNPIDRTDRPLKSQKTSYTVDILLADGDSLQGRVMSVQTRNLLEELNHVSGFIDFEAFSGERRMVAKASIISVKPVEVPRADQLKVRIADGFDPHHILEVERSADAETVKRSYHRLSKLYHPDRFASLGLPAEMLDYASAMSRRLNAAYALLQAREKVAAAAPERAPAATRW